MSEWTWYIWVVFGIFSISFISFWVLMLDAIGLFEKRDDSKQYYSPFELWMRRNHYGNWKQPPSDPPDVNDE